MAEARVFAHGVIAGRYRLLEVFSRETGRLWWYAEDLVAGRPRLVSRTVLPESAGDDTARRLAVRVLRACETVRLLRPDRIAAVVDAVVEDGALWAVTEWIDGTPLGGLLAREGPLDPARAARLGLDVLDVLQAAHDEGLTHGELSPGQVFVREDGPAVVTGFGTAGATLAPRLAAPSYAAPEQARDERIGPATDLWALGALLFRAVQGHAPYPEESTAELVQLVCAEPPAFAEECGPLRPVVESLLRQDPTERPDVEELSGWLRSLVRSAPEPEAGTRVVPVPPADPSRLPIVRRRGELVRRRRAGAAVAGPHGRHKRPPGGARSPRSLGRTLLLLVLLLLAGGIAYAMLFMPKQETGGDRTGSAGRTSPLPAHTRQPSAGQSAPDEGTSAPATETQTGGDPSVPDGFTLRKDADGFQVAVAEGWDRSPRNGSGQVVYAHGDFELIVVPGRDGASAYGSDPMAYQRDKEPELRPYRDSSWSTASGLRTTEVGGRTMAEGQFTWTDAQGRDRFVRNMALLLNGRYHIVQVRGPEAERDQVTRLYEQAVATYRYTR
ncbi:serine/threonine-protein kinase [Streptomyces sp. WELS2]|uniref:serine/threonine protein kinase n=1 Tax=Streptomyces sp. WELS2 TaxID=2749435 RepID=UPI00215DBC40|nr:serine/threonine-protein kinase [Streptomyces sp. WELS2]